jgi:polysaccharide deacetylase 2 family uncharacterized protein YibQ
LPRKKKNIIISFLSFFLPITALITFGIAAFHWYSSNHSKSSQANTTVREMSVKPEEFSGSLSEMLISTLSEFSVTRKDIKRVKSKLSVGGIKYDFTVNIPLKTSLTLLNYKINSAAKKNGGAVISASESADSQSLTLILGSRSIPTDMVIFKKNPGFEPTRVKAAIILDGVGMLPVEYLRSLFTRGQLMTLSIHPFQKYTEQYVDFAVENNIPYLLSMPFESKKRNKTLKETSILITDSEQTVRDKLLKSFKSVRGAQGLYNNLGSRAVEDNLVMESVMNFLKSGNYFYIDSKTTPESAGIKESKRIGVKSAEITGDIEYEGNRKDCENQLETLSNEALQKGLVIIVCHFHPTIISVLEKTLPLFDQKGIRLVGIKDAVK